MKTIILILKWLLITAVLSTNAIAKEEKNTTLVKLKPKMTTSPLTGKKYELNIEHLMPYLENITIVADPKLKQRYNKKNDNSIERFRTNFLVDSSHNRYVVGFENNSISLASKQDQIFVSGLAKERHYHYFLINPKFSYYHPDTGEYLGSEIAVIGTATINHRAELSSLIIESSKEPIKIGTFVIPSKSLKIPSVVQAITPKETLNGYVLSTFPDLGHVGATINNVVIVSLGAKHGVKVGHLLVVKNKDLRFKDPYNNTKQHTIIPKASKGEVLIYNVFDKLSIGLILKSTEEIKLLDRVANI